MNGDLQFLVTIGKIIIFLPFIIFLIYFSLKVGGEKLGSLQNGKYMKVLDRLPLTKDNSILAVKIGEKGYIISSTQGKIEILLSLQEEELKKLEESKKEFELLLRKKEKKEEKIWNKRKKLFYL